MKVVVDTNVLISGVFFGGFPKDVLMAVIEKRVTACASAAIVDEYIEVTNKMISRKKGKLNPNLLTPLINAMEIIVPTSDINECRDPDDDKFLECAVDANALFVVSGDSDLLVLKSCNGINIITAKEFCETYL